MKKKYMKPEIKVLELESTNDLICASIPGGEGPIDSPDYLG